MGVKSNHRYLSGLAGGSSAVIRYAVFEGINYMVVPVVAAIGDMVVRPLGSTGDEYVPAESLMMAPAGWNGRPILPTHPVDSDGAALSANYPQILERYRFGYMFNTRYANGALQPEAWLDPIRAKAVGEDAESVINRALAGEYIEVSVGALIVSDDTPGTSPAGIAYQSKWEEIIPDHLAMLPIGTEGACSVEMGCGAPRAAQQAALLAINNQLPIATMEKQAMKNKPNPLSTLWRSFTAAIRGAQGDTSGISDSELRSKLQVALRAVEPGFSDYYYDSGIFDVYQDTKTVVYCTYPLDELLLFQRTYNLLEDGAVTLNDDRQQVETALAYKVVNPASDLEAEIVAASGARHSSSDMQLINGIHSSAVNLGADCQSVSALSASTGNVNANPTPTANPTANSTAPACGCTKGDEIMDKSKVKGALARLHAGSATKEDRTLLATELEMTEGEMAAIQPSVTPVATTPAAAATQGAAITTPVSTPAAASSATPEELERAWLASNPPPHLVAMADRYKREEVARRADLSTRVLKAQSEFNADDLNAMPTDQLERMARALKVADNTADNSKLFLGRAFPTGAISGEGEGTRRRKYKGPHTAALGAVKTIGKSVDDDGDDDIVTN